VTTVVALGGNALTRPGQRGTAAEQLANLREAAEALKPVFGRDERVAITHGNGPQVGNELLRQERAADEVPPLPLWVAVAQTQAEIGALIRSELAPVAQREVACILTHVVVGDDDPAFGEPSKPIGPFYGADRARILAEERGWKLVFDAGRGYRRVVPSPQPLEVVELEAVRTLLDAGVCVIACGGGGVPVARRNGRLQGVDAVVDKDRASALLATELGADRLVVLTDVEAVYLGFRTPRQQELRELTADQAQKLATEVEAGSMRPKLEAAGAFARATGGEALITSAAALEGALARQAGTRVTSA
jgi:carbamate kinase